MLRLPAGQLRDGGWELEKAERQDLEGALSER